MPTWSTPPTFATGDLVTAAQMNILSDDLKVLKEPATSVYTNFYWGMSSTSTTFIDALSVTPTTNGGRLLVCAFGSAGFSVSNYKGYLNLVLDGTSIGHTTEGVQVLKPYSNVEVVPFSIAYLTDTLTATTHTVKFQFRVENSATNMSIGQIQYWVREVS